MIKYTFETVSENQFKISHDQLYGLFSPPIRKILEIFKKYDFEVRIVGGAIRDLLLGKIPRDVDLATNALPDQIIFMFVMEDIEINAKSVEHGTIKAIIDNEKYEVTSLAYSVKLNQAGKPIIHSSDSWSDDAKRRDYTVNSLSMDLQGNLYDYVNGLEDLKGSIVRGDINLQEKIINDPIIILRGCKLLSKFSNPRISSKTKDILLKNKELLSKIEPDKVGKNIIDILETENSLTTLKIMKDWGILKELKLRDDNIEEVVKKFNETKSPEEALSLMVVDKSQLNSLLESKILNELRKLPIIDTTRLEHYIEVVKQGIQNEQGKKWVDTVLRNYLISDQNLANTKSDPERTKMYYSSNGIEIPDWVKTSLEKNQDLYIFDLKSGEYLIFDNIIDFLNSDDAKPILDKLQRVSYPQMVELQRKWHEDLAKKKKEASLVIDEKNLKVIYKFKDGYRIVQLLTDKAKEQESNLMGHCVGRGGYREKTIFSLRDPQGEPHATMEIEGNEIVQLQGKANKALVEKYWPYMYEFIKNSKYILSNEYMKKTGLISINGVITEINKIPKGTVIEGDFDLSGHPSIKLPENLTVNGDMYISHSKIKRLPKNLVINGSLFAINSLIAELPLSIKIKEDLYLNNSKIEKLPEGLSIRGSMHLYKTSLSELPNNLTIGGDLSINDNLRILPENLTIRGTLNFHGNIWIQELPNTLKLGKSLIANNSSLRMLPNNLVINGNLDLNYSSVEYLPENLTVNGVLDIRKTKIKSLPNSLKVNGDRIFVDSGKVTYPKHLADKIQY